MESVREGLVGHTVDGEFWLHGPSLLLLGAKRKGPSPVGPDPERLSARPLIDQRVPSGAEIALSRPPAAGSRVHDAGLEIASGPANATAKIEEHWNLLESGEGGPADLIHGFGSKAGTHQSAAGRSGRR